MTETEIRNLLAQALKAKLKLNPISHPWTDPASAALWSISHEPVELQICAAIDGCGGRSHEDTYSSCIITLGNEAELWFSNFLSLATIIGARQLDPQVLSKIKTILQGCGWTLIPEETTFKPDGYWGANFHWFDQLFGYE